MNHLCAVCWEERPEETLIRETVGAAGGENEEAPGQPLENALHGRRARKITHWWHCREECVPRSLQFTVTGDWRDDRLGVAVVPALVWIQMREKALLWRFPDADGRLWVCRTAVMREKGRVQERDRLVWTVPLSELEERGFQDGRRDDC